MAPQSSYIILQSTSLALGIWDQYAIYGKWFEISMGFENLALSRYIEECHSPFFCRSKLLLIELIPHATIVILNSFILIKIVKSSKFRQVIMVRLEYQGSRRVST